MIAESHSSWATGLCSCSFLKSGVQTSTPPAEVKQGGVGVGGYQQHGYHLEVVQDQSLKICPDIQDQKLSGQRRMFCVWIYPLAEAHVGQRLWTTALYHEVPLNQALKTTEEETGLILKSNKGG